MSLSNSNIAGKLNYKHRRGDSFKRNITITNRDTGAAINLTGYTVKFSIKVDAVSSPTIDATTSNYITITGASGNIFTVNIPGATMQIAAALYVYDFEITKPDTTIETWAAGTFEIVQDLS